MTDAGRQDLDRAATSSRRASPTRWRRWPASPMTTHGRGIRTGPSVFCRRPRALGDPCGGNPVRLLQEASGERLRRPRSPTTEGCWCAPARFFEAGAARAPGAPASAGVPGAYFCAEYAVHASLPVYSAAWARSPATSSRRRRTAPCRSWRSASCTARATSTSASTCPGGSGSSGSRPTPTGCPPPSSAARTAEPVRHRPGPRRGDRGPGLASTSAASRCCCWTPSVPRTAPSRAGRPRSSTSAIR